LKEYYQKLKATILKDIDTKLAGPIEERSADKLKKALDIAVECDNFIAEQSASEWDKLSEKAQDEIQAILDRESNEEI
jgi:hypothetical protein